MSVFLIIEKRKFYKLIVSIECGNNDISVTILCHDHNGTDMTRLPCRVSVRLRSILSKLVLVSNSEKKKKNESGPIGALVSITFWNGQTLIYPIYLIT